MIARKFKMPAKITVSEHALLRWLERVKGVDLDAMREEILTGTVRAAAKLGASAVVQDGVTRIISGNCIVSVITEGDQASTGRGHNIRRGARQ